MTCQEQNAAASTGAVVSILEWLTGLFCVCVCVCVCVCFFFFFFFPFPPPSL
ncbi:hypothetical protein I7I48_05093 [Histoplasma ohiense]|nr:hypothetical protein I7I48_05093 [Histoplasma ohiense (nom. inval.)]